jgi:hypothetical protein
MRDIHRSSRPALIALLALALPATAAARQASTSGSSAPATESSKISPACAGDEYRQFDYWLGQWTVAGLNGAQLGTNHIIRVSDGCGIVEQWTDARGNAGTSINMYDRATSKWNQHWIGAQGGVIHLTGGIIDGAMQLEGKNSGPQGPVMDRVRWEREDEGKVRQLWTQSRDDGKTWQVVFNGLYSPVK